MTEPRYTAHRPDEGAFDLLNIGNAPGVITYTDEHGTRRTEHQMIAAPIFSDMPSMADDAGAGWVDDLLDELLDDAEPALTPAAHVSPPSRWQRIRRALRSRRTR